VSDYRATRKALGVVPQELVYDPFFTVREGLRIQSGYFGLRRNDDWIDEVMTHLDLLDKADRNMRTLSGGMKAARAGCASAGAQAAGDHPGRTHRRGGRGTASITVGIHPQAQ